MRMGPAKGAEVSTNDSTLGDPAAQEPPKRNLAWDIQKQKSPPDPPTSAGPVLGQPSVPPAPHLPLHH